MLYHVTWQTLSGQFGMVCTFNFTGDYRNNTNIQRIQITINCRPNNELGYFLLFGLGGGDYGLITTMSGKGVLTLLL